MWISARRDQNTAQFHLQDDRPDVPGLPFSRIEQKKGPDPCSVPTKTKYTSYVRFSSDPPATASLTVDHIAPQIQSFVGPNGTTLELANVNNPQNPADAGIRLVANTATHLFAGQFMFMQLLSPNNATYYRQINGNATSWTPNSPQPNPGFNLDNTGTLGYDTEAAVAYWDITSGNTTAATQYMNDSPAVYAQAATLDRLAAGFPGGGTPKSYTTFLMFKPDGYYNGVWVALQQVTWSWGAAAIVNADGSATIISTDTPTAKPNSAVGSWPTWSATAQQQQQDFYQGPNPWPQ